jgi:8-oxo-dGTP diphosphatase
MQDTDKHVRRPLVGVAIIVCRDGRVLVGKRCSSHGAGNWQFPGGHLEFGESIQQCAQREVYEETGMRIRNLRVGPYTNDVFAVEGKHYITLFVIADHDSGEPELKEPTKCEEWRWSSWRDLPLPHFLPMANLLRGGFNPFQSFLGSCDAAAGVDDANAVPR